MFQTTNQTICYMENDEKYVNSQLGWLETNWKWRNGPKCSKPLTIYDFPF